MMTKMLTKEEVKQTIYKGDLIDCTSEEYHLAIRRYLHECAAAFLDADDHVRAQIALSEVARLDRIFGILEKYE